MNNIEHIKIAKESLLKLFPLNTHCLIDEKITNIAEDIISEYFWENEEDIKSCIEDYVHVYESNASALESEYNAYKTYGLIELIDDMELKVTKDDAGHSLQFILLNSLGYIYMCEHDNDSIWLYIQD